MEALQRKTRLRRSVLGMAAAAVILILTLAAAVFVTGRLYRDAHKWTLHTYQVREQILELTGHLQLAEMDARNYGLTGRDVAFQQYWRHIAAVEHDAAQLAERVTDNSAQVAATKQLATAIAARRTQFERILGDYRTHGAEAAHVDVVALVSQPDQPVRALAEAMLDREAALLAQREATSERYGKRVTLVASLALAGCLTLLLVALINSGFERRRRQRSELELERNAAAFIDAGRTAAELPRPRRSDQRDRTRAAAAVARRVGCAGVDQRVAQHRRGAHALGRARLRPRRRDLCAGRLLGLAPQPAASERQRHHRAGLPAPDAGRRHRRPRAVFAAEFARPGAGRAQPVHARGDHGGHATAGHDRRGPVGAGARQPADHAHARERAEAIRKATAELVVHYRAGTLPPATVSIGVATYPEHGDTPEALLRMADQALYRAKQLGRNVVASAGDLARTANAQAVPATT